MAASQVNTSPALNADSPLDWRIKTSMIAGDSQCRPAAVVLAGTRPARPGNYGSTADSR
jgi:hypothetical protein